MKAMTGHHAASSSYSPLESLLVLQSVLAVNNQTDAFKNISDALRQSTLLESRSPDLAADADKFRPEALQDLYLQLLKDEASKQVANSKDHQTPNGISELSEDAKLADVEDREQLVSEVVDKLYAQYKDQVIKEIREDEQKYDNLVKELHELEEDEAKRKLEQQPGTSTSALDREESQTQVQPEELSSKTEDKDRPSLPLRLSPSSEAQPGPAKLDGHETKQPVTPAPDSEPAVAISQTSPQNPPLASPSSTQTLPPIRTAESQPTQSLSQPPPDSTPHLPLPPVATTPYPSGSPVVSHQRSPRIDPPPQNAATSTSTTPLLSQYGTSATQEQKPLNQQNVQAQPTDPSRSQSQTLRARGEDIRKYITQTPVRSPYQASGLLQTPGTAQSSIAIPQPQPRPQHASQRGGIQLPPFSVNPQAPVTSHAALQETRPQPQPSAAPSNVPSTPIVPPDSILRAIRDLANYNSPRLSAATTPVGSARGFGSRKPGTHISPGSTTRWKSGATTPAANVPSERLRPRSRSVSPISDTEKDQRAPAPKRPGRPSFGKASNNAKPSASLKPPVKLQGRRTSLRPGSRTPSAAPTASGGIRTRSPSVTSHADELSMSDNAKTDARFKHETAVSDEDNHRTAKSKRKWSSDHYDSHHSPVRHAPAPIQAFRNFSRMANPVMNTINTHRHASMFAHPVKERDAEGYAEIIRRPQDLKSIRAALGNGNRAVVAALSAEVAVSSPGGDGASGGSKIIQLGHSPELVPPKGIVNGAQLEQEIMRMFANAVMFNPGSEGVVQDTREMFEEVEANLTSLTALDRSTGGGGWGTVGASVKEEDEEADELAGDSAGTTTVSSVRKRRA